MTSDLRCDYMIEPLGVDNPEPELSWKLISKAKDKYQSAYRILVSSDIEKLNNDIGDLWDSGKVISSDETAIDYGGKELSTGDECFWKVMAWDEKGVKSKWSKAAKWSMGLIADDAWDATWIGFDQPRVDANDMYVKEDLDYLLVPPRYLRKEFAIDKPVSRAMLYVSALGNYKMSINGKEASMVNGSRFMKPVSPFVIPVDTRFK